MSDSKLGSGDGDRPSAVFEDARSLTAPLAEALNRSVAEFYDGRRVEGDDRPPINLFAVMSAGSYLTARARGIYLGMGGRTEAVDDAVEFGLDAGTASAREHLRISRARAEAAEAAKLNGKGDSPAFKKDVD